ncbi:MAG: hypothetical protein HC877_01725 [Thioploca sp.]|nr:hypothetical protein [Thioploca sp.]
MLTIIKREFANFFILLVFSLSSPIAQSSWTGWFDRDNPSGTGDWEDLGDLGDVCFGEDIVDVQARRISDQLPAENTGQVFLFYNTTNGFVCRNVDQVNNEQCFDYEVRFKCESLLVDLLSFSAENYGNQVILKWKTTSEIDSTGFNIYRARGKSGKNSDYLTAVRITGRIISPKGEGSSSDYSYTDTNNLSNGTYYYLLEDISDDGNSTFHCNQIDVVTIGQGSTIDLESAIKYCKEVTGSNN